ncbi:hypothetical protein EGN69_04260 [Pseudomonas monteilii]|nr:hypothetical protein EGN69_04260 [Pseudomonas monteilii]
MPLPWLIGVAAVAAAAAIAKAVSDDSPSSSSSTTHSDDSERRQQEQEAKRQRERENLKARVQSLAGDRREQLKAQLRVRHLRWPPHRTNTTRSLKVSAK